MALLDNFENFGNALGQAYGAGGPGDQLIGIGMGLLSRRGVGPAMAQGFQNVATMSDLTNQRQRQAMLDKLAQERETRQAAWQDWQRQHTLEQEKAAQANSDRSYNFQVAQANKPSLVEVPLPDGTTQKQWISPGGVAGTTVGAPVKQRTPAMEAEEKANAEYKVREGQLTAQGLDPKDPKNQQFLLTGKFPREDAQPLSATDKKAILEADESISTNEAAISALNHAKDVSKKAWGFPGASTFAKPASLVSEGAQNTVDLDNTVIEQALTQLKAIFGGNPTEGERAILLQLQGSSSQPDAVRQKIYDRAIQAAQRRLDFNKQRASELRGGTYYNAKGAAQAPAQPDVPAPSVSFPSWSIEK